MRVILILFFLLCGCNGSNLQKEVEGAHAVGMTQGEIRVDGFSLTYFKRLTSDTAPIRVYIEGDGYAWITATIPSGDPTPRNPLALKLALQDLSDNVLYLARPCQYSLARSPACEVSYWTDQRFSETVVRVMDQALTLLTQHSGNRRIELVGYSGGAAIAVLLAARCHDIVNLRTIAGNLDHDRVNRYHNVSLMPASLNSMDLSEKVRDLPQLHFVGNRDAVVPEVVAHAFVEKEASACAQVIEVEGATHASGWVERWHDLVQIPLECR
jgi:pimeloyl-ACP methyl ester carboxylesterase